MNDICPSRDDAQPHIVKNGYCTLCYASVRPGWTKLRVGCYWTKGPFTVSTVRAGNGSRSGYALVKDYRVIAEYITWEEVERLTEDKA